MILWISIGSPLHAQWVLTEFLANNQSGLRDADGETSDWIEVQNVSQTSQNLAQWSLTDDVTQPQLWPFPGTNLPPGAFLVVFASGKNRTNAGAELHTSFRLSANGGYLGLFAPETTVGTTEFSPFPPQRADISYGNRGGHPYFFNPPTPGAANVGGFADFIADTKFSQSRGFFEAPFALTITTATTNATIRYTTNGATPTATLGFVYSGPIQITGTTIIRAGAFEPGLQPSGIDTQTYLFAADIIRQQPTGKAPSSDWPAPGSISSINYGMDPRVVNAAAYKDQIIPALKALPSFSLVTDLPNLFSSSTGIYSHPDQDGRAWERPCSLEFIRTDGQAGFHVHAGVRIRGGFSRSTGNPKHAFRLFFREEYGTSKLKYPLHAGGTDVFDALDLRTFENYSWSFQGDPVGIFVRDQFSRDTQLALGQPGERGIYAHLFINGIYWGLYNTDERPEATYGATYFGGSSTNYDVVKVEAGPYSINATDGNLNAWTRLYNTCKAGVTNNAKYFALEGRKPDGSLDFNGETLLDINNLIDYQVVIFWGGNLDASVSRFLGDTRPNNWYGLRDRTGKNGGFRFIAHDSEHTLKADEPHVDRTGPFSAGTDSVVYSNPHFLHQKLSDNLEYRLRFADRVQRACFSEGPLTTSKALAHFNVLTNLIQLAVIGESARWGDSKVATPLTQATWLTAVRNVQNIFIQSRTATLMNQLRAKKLYPGVVAPSLSQFGGPIGKNGTFTLTAPAGNIYYTLTGEDPRVVGGEVFSGAIRYTGPISVNQSLTLKTRARLGTEWSALVETDFTVIQTFRELQVTEIMYRPAATQGVNRDDLEFVELKNVGNAELDLDGMTLTNAVEFVFPRGTRLAAGKFLILVGNLPAFTNRYPTVRPFGEFHGKLGDNGDRVTLVHAVGTLEFDVAYDQKPPWPAGANGLGFSLVPQNPNSNPSPNDPANWRTSAQSGGSPGADDPVVNVPVVWLNEFLTHTDPPQRDSIELFNPGEAIADISGWYLTDDRSLPKKYRFPPSSSIPPHGYYVIDESKFDAPDLGTNAFRLNSHGEAVFLYSANDLGELTGYTDGTIFGAAQNGVSFGRYVDSTGEIQFPPQRETSLGAQNSGPRIGPVVINEILFIPAPGEIPFVELKNFATTNVPLFDVTFPTNRWRLEGAGFEFPTGASLAPGGLAIVAGGDPTAFRNRYGVPSEVPVFGPFSGVLQGNGERLELQRPDAPDPVTNQLGAITGYFVPYLTVDLVRYSRSAPWPTNGIGLGASLERRMIGAFGNDPINWRASGQAPTPGNENDGNRPPRVIAGSNQELMATRFPLRVPLSGSATDDGLPKGQLTYTWSQSAGLPGVVFDIPASAVTTAQLPGQGVFTLRLTVSDGLRSTSDELSITVSRPGAEVTVIPFGSTWSYFDQRQDLGTGWRVPAYVESAAWKSGPARLGYGGDGEVTTLNSDPAPDRNPTAYFRKKFTAADPKEFTALTLQLVRDDGAAVYLNGEEVFRSNLPEGEILFTTLADVVVGGADEHNHFDKEISPAGLRAGENTFAVEVHQQNGGSSDLSFDLALIGLTQAANQAPTVDVGPELTTTLPAAATLHGRFTDDGLPSSPGVPTFTWNQVSGPGTTAFGSPNKLDTEATFSVAGTYQLKLTADDGALSGTAVVRVIAKPATVAVPPVLMIERTASGWEIQVRYQADAGRSYTLRRRLDLENGPWVKLQDTPEGISRIITVAISATETQQFFQLITPAPP